MPRIFISYRQADSEGHVGRLYDHLARLFDASELFRDLNSLRGGDEFSPACEQAVAACEVFIPVIGPAWLDIRDSRGRRRLDNPRDLVRREIATALQLGKRVFPVLVGGAARPRSSDLPGDISTLFEHNAIELSPERFAYDVERLVEAIGGACGKVTILQPPKRPRRLLVSKVPFEAQFQMWIDQQARGEFDVGEAITVNVEAGQHTVHVRIRLYEWERFDEWDSLATAMGRETNHLQFEIKGGQTIRFLLATKAGLSAPKMLVEKAGYYLELYQPVIKM